MEGRAEGLQDPLPHLGIAVDENDPRSNLLVLLKELRPEWKPEEIKLKASGNLPSSTGLY